MYFTTFSGASILDFEQINASLVLRASYTNKLLFVLLKSEANSGHATHL